MLLTGQEFVDNHWHLNLQSENGEDYLITAEVKKVAGNTMVCVPPFKPADWRHISLPNDQQKIWLLRQLVHEIWNVAVRQQAGAHHVVFNANGLPGPDSTNHVRRREQFWQEQIFEPLGLVFLQMGDYSGSRTHGWLVVPKGGEGLFIRRLRNMRSDDPLHEIHNHFVQSPAFRRL